jgi:hypothetical protein
MAEAKGRTPKQASTDVVKSLSGSCRMTAVFPFLPPRRHLSFLK